MVQNCKHFRFHDVTCQKRMGAIFDTDPKTPSAPAGTNVSSRGALQKFWEFRSFLEHSSVGTRLVSLTRCHVTSWTARSWTGLGLAACHFLDRQILDWVRVRVRVRVRVAVQELTVQDRTVQEPSGSPLTHSQVIVTPCSCRLIEQVSGCSSISTCQDAEVSVLAGTGTGPPKCGLEGTLNIDVCHFQRFSLLCVFVHMVRWYNAVIVFSSKSDSALSSSSARISTSA